MQSTCWPCKATQSVATWKRNVSLLLPSPDGWSITATVAFKGERMAQSNDGHGIPPAWEFFGQILVCGVAAGVAAAIVVLADSATQIKGGKEGTVRPDADHSQGLVKWFQRWLD